MSLTSLEVPQYGSPPVIITNLSGGGPAGMPLMHCLAVVVVGVVEVVVVLVVVVVVVVVGVVHGVSRSFIVLSIVTMDGECV